MTVTSTNGETRRNRFQWLFAAVFASAFIGGGLSLFTLGGIELYPLRIATTILLPRVLMRMLRTSISLTPRHLTVWVLLCTLAWGGLSIAWSPDCLLGIRSFAIMTTGVVLTAWVIAYAGNREDRMVATLRLWAVCSLFTSIIGFYEVSTGSHLFIYVDDTGLVATERAAIFLGWLPPQVFNANWNNFAFINALSFFVMLGTAMSPAMRQLRALAVITSLLLLGLVAASVSRAAVGGVAIGIGLFAFLATGGALRAIHRSFKSIWFPFILLASLLGGLYVWKNYGSLISYLIDFLIQKNDRFEGLGERSKYYQKAIESVFGSYGLGAGLGASTVIIDGASYHQHFLEILAELGPVIFFLHVVLHARIAWLCFKKRHHPDWGPLFIAIATASVVLPILCIGPSSVVVEPVYWLWLGVSAVAASSTYSLRFKFVPDERGRRNATIGIAPAVKLSTLSRVG